MKITAAWIGAIVLIVSDLASAKTPPRSEPTITFKHDGDLLKYTYDLSTVFDRSMWRVLEENGYSEIMVEVRVRDASEKVRHTQYHSFKVELLSRGRVRVMTTRRRGRIYSSRIELLNGLRSVPGTPIPAKSFAGESGHIELVVLVNPVQVYGFPVADTPLAHRQVIPKTYYDRRLEMRSKSFKR